MDSESVKKTIIRQTLLATNTTNARTLIENINEQCFERCVPKPGGSLTSGEENCMKQCMEKYMAAWNVVNASYIRRIQQEMGNQQPLGNH
ncbi:protein translocase subunit [Collariella sp. IMI 366227]|nr:protein translocase subunit [Collariella sp. IMI 366227]